jgi:uncharacterized protein (TIGR03086 family)
VARSRPRRHREGGPQRDAAASALGILSVEFLVHAWAYAQATGQQVTVSDELAEHVLGVARAIITPAVRSGGSFADAVPTGPDAGVLDRLIAYTGRDVMAGPDRSR